MAGNTMPFAGEGAKTTCQGMSIEIPSRTSSGGSSSEDRKEQHYGKGSRTFHHHPCQPGLSSDSCFFGSLSGSAVAVGSKTPGQWRGHSRNVSQSSTVSAVSKSHPISTSVSACGANAMPFPAQNLQSGSAGVPDWTLSHHPTDEWGQSSSGGGLPSSSTLTDILLGLHSTLYGAKRSPEEVREMVWRFYDADAIFESPLLSAHGREQVANQFIMAFALPGIDVTSELRDVICSDFEFDGTRAGIIDQTISVTFLPSIFGSDAGVSPSAYPQGPSDRQTPGLHIPSHSAITPHPFADYCTPSISAFGHIQHSPTTPFNLNHLWGGGSSRPHTPGEHGPVVIGSGVRPFTTSISSLSHNDSAPLSIKNEDDYNLRPNSVFAGAEHAGGSNFSRLKMPLDAILPHWGSEGLGRSTVSKFLWGLLHPRAVLKQLCTIHLRLMSRLEFNDAGHIIRHEDTWGLRETIEGIIPFASLIYALERRIVGYITSWAIEKGFSLSAALSPLAIEAPMTDPQSEAALLSAHKHDRQFAADDAAYALLGRPHGLTLRQHEIFQTVSRSRAPSPSRFCWHSSHSQSATPYVMGTRARARSSTSLYGSRAASTENLVGLSAGAGPQPYFATGYERGADKELPPDSSARYRGLNKHLEGGRPSSIAFAPPSESVGSTVYDCSDEHGRSKAPDCDSDL